MAAKIQNREEFVDMERLLQSYFDNNLCPVLDEEYDKLNKQITDAWDKSFKKSPVSGSMAGNLGNVMRADYDAEHAGAWKDGHTEYLVKACNERWEEDATLTADIQQLTGGVSVLLLQQLGEEQYQQLSDKYGGDLAGLYVAGRLQCMIMEELAEKQAPKSVFDYIVRNGFGDSLIGFVVGGKHSDLDTAVADMANDFHHPSIVEQASSFLLSNAVDYATLGGIGKGASSFLKFSAIDFAVRGGVSAANTAYSLFVGTDGENFSKDIFGSRKALSSIQEAAWDSSGNWFDVSKEERGGYRIKTRFGQTMSQLKKDSGVHIDVRHDVAAVKDMTEQSRSSTSQSLAELKPAGFNLATALPATPDYVSQLREDGERYFAMREKSGVKLGGGLEEQEKKERPVVQGQKQQSVSGWNGLLDSLGLSGFGDVGKNLGYVIAMLPDLLIGMFTGQTKRLNISDNLMPLAAIFGGMFVKNPLIKMLLIGYGGANLLNKAGHEALDHAGIRNDTPRQYKTYQEENLDRRIKNPAMQGNTLVADIDGVPMVLTVSDEAVDAYYKGALPLNTLSNAVLRAWDRQQSKLSESYEQGMSEEREQTRSRGIQ